MQKFSLLLSCVRLQRELFIIGLRDGALLADGVTVVGILLTDRFVINVFVAEAGDSFGWLAAGLGDNSWTHLGLMAYSTLVWHQNHGSAEKVEGGVVDQV